MKYVAILSVIAMQCFAIEPSSNTSNSPEGLIEYQIQKKEVVAKENENVLDPMIDSDSIWDDDDDDDDNLREPSEQEIATILQKADEIYQNDMGEQGEYFDIVQSAKEIIPSLLYQTTIKNSIPSLLKLRETFFQKLHAICEKYPEDKVAQKIKSEIDALPAIDQKIATNIVSLLFGVKLSDNNLYLEDEITENTIRTLVKIIIIVDLCDDMDVDEDPVIIVFLVKAKEELIKICSSSNNEFLNKLVTYLKTDISLDDIKSKFFTTVVDLDLDEPSSPFEKDVTNLLNAQVNEIKEIFPNIANQLN